MDDRKPSGNNQILKEKMKIGISIVIEAVLIMLEIYVLTQMQDQLLIAGAMVIPMALTLYFLILSIINVSQYNKRMELERYEDLYNAQKASYLIVRKSFEELSKRLEDLEQVNNLPAEEIINAQKAVAKLTISRNKENALALMESNESLIEQLSSLERELKQNNSSIAERQEKLLEQTKKDLIERNRDLERQLLELQAKVAENRQIVMPPMYAQPAPQMMPQQMDTVSRQQDIKHDDYAQEETDISFDGYDTRTVAEAPSEEPELNTIAETIPTETEEHYVESDEDAETDTESEIAVETEPVIEAEAEPTIEAEAEATPEPVPVVTPVSDDPNHVMTPDEIAAMFSGANAAEPVAEETAEAEPAIEAEEEPAIEDEAEATPEPVPVVTPVSDDPNHVMTPDEIAAMFAGASTAESQVEAEPIAEPVVEETAEAEPVIEAEAEPAIEAEAEPEAVIEEKAAEPVEEKAATSVPDLSNNDPNKMLTPEEIEKLFANL
ncbi:MAG: hypothetical protein PUJ10_09095 [Lachnospiraceae bacterium]|nr:hypothetical protein [Lachnospiraceae bacterium]